MADAKSVRGARRERPMSPHLQVYTLLINMVASMLHRVSGAALYFGALLFAWWLMAAAIGPEYFDFVNGLFGAWYGRIVLLGLSWLLILHALGGIRHYIWDLGRGYDLKTIDKLSWGTLILSVVLTGIIWLVASLASPVMAPVTG
ncbi:MAG: succinate dehydrogenase, cytochrome b556 subunit [Hyphomicrobiaceae bacterium]